MGKHSIPVFDADGHVYEDPEDIYRFYEGKFEKMHLNVGFSMFPSLDGWQRGVIFRDRTNQFGKGAPTDIKMWETMLDRMGLDGSVLYPTQALTFGLMNEDEWVAATATAYNNWIEERFTRQSPRLYAAGIMSARDPQAAAKELRRCARDRTRFVGMMLPTVTNTGRYFGDRFYDPVWEAAVECDMAVAFHGGPTRNLGFDHYDEFIKVHAMEHPLPLMIQMTDIVFSGVFDRFPKLRIGFLEGGCSWIPFMMDRLDYEFGSTAGTQKREQLRKRPSDYFREGENIWVSMELGERGLKYTIDAMDGPGHILYASDFPHEPTEENLIGELPEFIASPDFSTEVKKTILYDNTKTFYRMS